MLKVLAIILGVLMIAGGIYCLALPEVTFLLLGYIVGIVMILDGVERLILWFKRDRGTDQGPWSLISGIFSLIMGIILIGNDLLQLFMDSFIVYMTIGWLIVLGFARIAHAFQTRRLHAAAKSVNSQTVVGKDWWVALILGILLVISGVVGFFVPAVVGTALGIMIGVALIVAGVNMIHFGTTTWMYS